ncbi:MAG: sulfite exporter TauE/SafE family protein [Magnetococcales bacterium]|nr:sulfite exporter TauE/SafE family protein [Magnetococcales bacterium]
MSSLLIGSVITGLAAGVVAGLFGVGGGIIIVPVLLFLFHLDGFNPAFSMQLAVGTSLATIIITNISATWNHQRRNSVHWQLFFQFTPGILIGAWLGAIIAAVMDGQMLKQLFGAFEILVGLRMIFSGTAAESTTAIKGNTLLNSTFAIGIGTVSSMFGIGGGTLSVPVLNMINKLPIRMAVGTSSAIGVALAMAGAGGFIHAGWNNAALPTHSWGFVVPEVFIGIIIGTLITTPFGVRLAHGLDPHILKRSFGLFLLIVGAKLLL